MESHNELVDLLISKFAAAINKMNESQTNELKRTAALVLHVFFNLISGIKLFLFFPVPAGGRSAVASRVALHWYQFQTHPGIIPLTPKAIKNRAAE